MSATIGIVRMNGKIFRVPKADYETDERLQDRAWLCAKEGTVDACTISRSHKWANEKYFNMKYSAENTNDGNRS
jgi:hypothetical protein